MSRFERGDIGSNPIPVTFFVNLIFFVYLLEINKNEKLFDGSLGLTKPNKYEHKHKQSKTEQV